MKSYYLFLIIFTFFFSGCSNSGSDSPKEKLGDIYSVALDSLMEKDQALSSDIKYIAIDMSNFKGITEKEKKQVLSFFEEKYQVETMDATLDTLEDKGLYNDDIMGLEDGVLLSVENMKYKLFNTIYVECSKFRSGKGAIGVETTIHFKKGKWQVKKSEEIWVS